MRDSFCCIEEFDELIKAGREIVADRTLFCAKKKYIARLVNLDGKDIDPTDKKALKIMGVEIKKSDTPKVIQKFLRDVVSKVLDGVVYKEIETFVNNFRKSLFTDRNLIEIGIPKSVNKLDDYYQQWSMTEKKGIGKVTLPGNVRAAINHNEMIKDTHDQDTIPIITGSKIKLFYIKPNDRNFKSVAISGDADRVPKWFTEHFKVDEKLMSEKLIDDKISILFTPIGWEVPTARSAIANSLLEF